MSIYKHNIYISQGPYKHNIYMSQGPYINIIFIYHKAHI